MLSFSLLPPRDRRPPLGEASSLRSEVCPPSLRQAPDSAWHRVVFWLLAPAPGEASLPANRLPGVRADFAAVLADIDGDDADALRNRIAATLTLRELWHLRAELYRVVGVAHRQSEAEIRVGLLNRHFPLRAPRPRLGLQ